MRDVKDPFRTAEASRLLPEGSSIQILQVGAALTARHGRRAEREMRSNPRYRWVGEKPRWRAVRLLARSRLLVLTSISEGGAHVVSEALACGVPVLSTHIPGSIGLLGRDYPGYFPVGDTQGLADLLLKSERDTAFYKSLKTHIRSRRAIVRPSSEKASLRALIRELVA